MLLIINRSRFMKALEPQSRLFKCTGKIYKELTPLTQGVQTKNSSVHVLALPFVEFPSMIQEHRLAF
jgi:hypothetical protein